MVQRLSIRRVRLNANARKSVPANFAPAKTADRQDAASKVVRANSRATTLAIAALFSIGVWFDIAVGDDAPRPIYTKGAQLRVLGIKRIWSEGRHNAFPDIQRFRDRWFVATREGTAHGISGFGRVRIIASDDGERWRSVALFDGFGDYRRGELSVTADGRLMLTAKFNVYGKADDTAGRTYQASDHTGKQHEVLTAGAENRVAFSDGGVHWTEMQAVKGTHPSAWFYSGVQWSGDVGYAIDRQGRKLYRTRDGVHFEPVSEVPVGNESRISFLPDETMVVFFRNGCLAASPTPYTEWTVNERNKQGPHSYGGPGILALPDGQVWTASRHRIDPQAFDFPPEENVFPDGTVLFQLEGERLAPKLLIRGGGDRGYNGLAWHEDLLWMVYNAPSREAGKSCIYFAKIRLK